MLNKRTLPIIIISQLFCTSLWFAGNSVINDLISTFDLSSNSLSYLTSSVQFGFITGTLLFALFSIADRFPPSKIFFASATIGALINSGVIVNSNTFVSLLILRFFTGFSLAGIYPIGMKIAADYYKKGLGKSLGFLVGALVLGTAFPHLIKTVISNYSWKYVIILTSFIAFLGGILMYLLVPKGPFCTINQSPNFKEIGNIFKNYKFKTAAFGYFGHMWELYAFWTFVPVLLLSYEKLHPETNFHIPLLSFVIIGLGSLACVFGGYLSERLGLQKTATLFLTASCICCLLSPLFFYSHPSIFIGFLIIWGLVVIADSPLFSTLVTQHTEDKTKGTALTIVNCIGFSITIVSIQIVDYFAMLTNTTYIYMLLAVGPLLGLKYLFIEQKKAAIKQ